MKVRILASIIIILTAASASASTKSTVVIDTPTAYTIARGTYQISLLGYDNGGVELKTFIGLHDHFFLGVSMDVQNAIGQDAPKPNVPGVIARLKFTDGWPALPLSISIGYDSFYIGSAGRKENPNNEINKMIYGPYLVFTSPIYLLYDEQFVSYGVRMPTQPDYVPEDTSYFVAIDIPMGESFRFKYEMERIYYNLRDSDEWLFNFGIRYSYLDQLGIEFDLLVQPDVRPNRILRIEYHNEF